MCVRHNTLSCALDPKVPQKPGARHSVPLTSTKIGSGLGTGCPEGREETQNPLTNCTTSHNDSDHGSVDFCDYDSDDGDFDVFSKDKGMACLTKGKWDHRFHRFFAFLLHFMTLGVTYFSFKYALDPKDIKHEVRACDSLRTSHVPLLLSGKVTSLSGNMKRFPLNPRFARR